LLRKLVLAVPTLVGASVVVFFGLRMVPGDPAVHIAGDLATPAVVEEIRQELGLDQPIPVQYVRFVGAILHGDFGRSLQSQEEVTRVIANAIPISAELAVISLSLSTILGVTAGTLAAIRQYSLIDNALSVGMLAGIAVPAFWSGLLLILFLGLFLGLLPIGGVLSDTVSLPRITGAVVVDSVIQGRLDALQDAILHLVMPAITLALAPTAIIGRMTRSCVLDVLRADYIRTARGKGIDERTVILRHALKNASIPVVTLIGLQAGYLISGAVVVETIFARPGIGWLAANAVLFRDYPLVQGIVLFAVSLFVVTNLAVDLLYGFLDPRTRYA
jgi:peptide/nickel transport system permease protein